MKTYGSGGINWAWYLEAEIMGDEVKILRHYRLHYDRDDHPSTVGAFQLIEEKREAFSVAPRLVVGVELGEGGMWKKYKVSNPKGPFDYE